MSALHTTQKAYSTAAFFLIMIGMAPFHYLISINLVTALFFFYDKKIAGKDVVRVPENLLLGLSTFGGGIGAGLVMFLLRHKTSKESFLNAYYGSIAIQIVGLLIFAYFHLVA